MINLGVLLVGFLLGVFSLSLLIFLVVLHRPRYESPTLNRRRNRDKQVPSGGYQPLAHTRMGPPPPPAHKPARDAEAGAVDYRFINLTGLEND
jgi:hypothetical protein